MLNQQKKEDLLYGGVHVYQTLSQLSVDLGAINLAQGIPAPYFDEVLLKSMCASLGTSWQYTPTQGLLTLRQCIANYYFNEFDADHEILITAGCTEALLCACMAAHQLGKNRIVLFEPFYSYYPGLLQLSGCVALFCPLQIDQERFIIDFNCLENILQQGADVILMNVPHNPTGMTLANAEWEKIYSLCTQYEVMMILDEVYAEFQYENKISKEIKQKFIKENRLIVAHSISKMFAAAGVRLGWLAGPSLWIESALYAHMHMSNCILMALQNMGILLFHQINAHQMDAIRKRYQQKRERLMQALKQYGFKCYWPSGGHFITASYEELPQHSLSALDFCYAFAHHVGVVPLPLNNFVRKPNHFLVRFSFAVDEIQLNQACDRLTNYL